MRGIAQRVGAQHEDVIEAEAFPVDPAEIGDAHGAFHAQHAEGHQIADFQACGLREILVEGHQRFAFVHRSPPAAGGQFVSVGQSVGIGQPAFAAQRPGAIGDLLELGRAGHRRVIAEGQYRAAQGGHGAPAGIGVGFAHQRLELGHLVARNVEHEVIGRAVGHTLGDIAVDRGLHRGEQDEGGQPETQRGHQCAGRTARSVEVGQRIARNRAARARDGSRQLADAEADQRKQSQYCGCTGEEAGRQQGIAGCQQGQRDNRGQPAADQHQRLGIARQRGHARTHQRHGRKLPRAQQGRGSEHQCHQHAVSQRKQDRPRIDHHAARHGQQALQRGSEERDERDPDHDPRQASGQRGGDDLQGIDAGDVAARCAEDLQRGNALPPGVEIGGHAAADADPGNDQRGEPDQREEFAHPVDETVSARRGAVGGVDVETGFGEAVFELFLDGFEIAALVEPDAGLRLVHRTGRNQPRTHRQVFGHDDRRAELETFAKAIGFGLDNTAHAQRLGADRDRRAGGDAQPVGGALRQPCLTRGRRADRAAVG